MKVSDFAENILFGTTLESKLLQPKDILFDHRGLTETPHFPGRPPELDLHSWHNRPKVPFPNAKDLEKEKARGTVFHFFANHELLAIEIMALALLKFPDAPPKFREGIVRTIFEEQKHMRLYASHMQKMGVMFGEIPVNDFFWSCMKDMKDPMDFVVQMSLTFEQANLDYCLHYKNLFEKIGDKEGSALLQLVYEEEIGHVKHGVSWMNKWKDESEDDWDTYLKRLNFPMSPSRAKGLGFDREAREKAGLSDRFISELLVYSSSKGRPPNVFFMNISCESEVARGTPGFSAGEEVRLRNDDFSQLQMFLAHKEDVVLVSQKPSVEYLTLLKSFGFEIPEFLPVNDAHKVLKERKLSTLQPWGWSPQSLSALKSLLPYCLNSEAYEALLKRSQNSEIHSKSYSSSLLKKFVENDEQNEIFSKVIKSMDELITALEETPKSEFPLALKAPFGSSGQNIQRVFSTQLSPSEINWATRILLQEKEIVVEPWLNKVADFSIQLHVDEEGKVSLKGISRFLTDPRGQYRGTVLGRFTDGLRPEILRTLHQENFFETLEKAGYFVGESLFRKGYSGPAGVDALIYEREGRFLFKPIVEVNARYTMGRVALEIGKHLAPGTVGVWLHVSKRHLLEAGFSSFQDFHQKVQASHPVGKTDAHPKSLKEGVVFTQDPATSQAAISFLIIGKSLDACRGFLPDVHGKISEWKNYIS